MSSGGVGSDGKIYCKHMEEAVRRKSKTSKHPNRDFYCCRRPIGGQNKCNFFLWADEIRDIGSTPVVNVPLSSLSSALATPQPSSTGGAAATHSVPASPTRPEVSSSNSPALTGSPQTRRRLEHIKMGLQQRKQNSFSHDLGLSEVEGPSSFSGVEVAPQPPSPVPTEIDDTGDSGEQPGESFRSFLGISYGKPSAAVAKEETGQPSTPKKRRLTPPAGSLGKQTGTSEISASKLPLTPPESTHHDGRFERQKLSVSSSWKGKEREDAPSASARDQYVRAAGSSTEQGEDSLPLFTNPEEACSSSSASPTTAENVLDYTNGVRDRVKGLSEYMDSFEIDHALKSLQSIERRGMQSECRDRSQKRRMDELVAENSKLVAEVSRLKEALQSSEASHRAKDAEIALLKARAAY